GGISEALITTEFGLMVAIPAFVLHAVLSRRAKAILSDMEKISSEYISKNCG
ncbi:MAG: MotA/TolQ/ExbB proton channel family protein, partial [Opitutales bacterium]|nr:MotA/TolQ/ExbB proton channel family protein [Opitutales bacterium]